MTRADRDYGLAVEIHLTLVRDYPTRPRYRWALAAARLGHGKHHVASGRLEEASRLYQDALTDLDGAGPAAQGTPDFLSLRAGIYAMEARLFDLKGDWAAACRPSELAVRDMRAALGFRPDNLTWQRYLRENYFHLARRKLTVLDHAGAAKAAAEIPPLSRGDWRGRLMSAYLLARCASTVGQDDRLAADRRHDLRRAYEESCHQHLEAAVSLLGPSDHEARAELARFLATCPVEGLRDLDRAVEWARAAVAAVPKNE